LQIRALRFALLVDWGVGVGVFQEGK